MSTATAPRTLSLWKSHEGHYLIRDERVQIMAQLARCSKARLMCGQLSILSSYFFLYLDYCAGGSVRAAACLTCDQMRGGSPFTCTFTRLHAHSRNQEYHNRYFIVIKYFFHTRKSMWLILTRVAGAVLCNDFD